MQFQQIINSKISKESDRPLMQKDPYAVSAKLQSYLEKHNRGLAIPIAYTDLLYYSHANSLRDKKGKLTHWETAIYYEEEQEKLNQLLAKTYAILKRNNTKDFIENLTTVQIDFCEFGNSIPFRIMVRYKDTGFIDHYYIKVADASRIYGLELEQLLSPNETNFLYYNNTLVEEHIAGVPGDTFIKKYHKLSGEYLNIIAKEFVQFNERCFARLLGDMRSYNFVIDEAVSETNKFRIRSIDFDQQCYEGRKNLYIPQFYKENYAFVKMTLDRLSEAEISTCQQEERNFIKGKTIQNKQQLAALMDAMVKDELSENYKILLLRKELNEHFNTTAFSHCKTMGALVKKQLTQVLG